MHLRLPRAHARCLQFGTVVLLLAFLGVCTKQEGNGSPMDAWGLSPNMIAGDLQRQLSEWEVKINIQYSLVA